MVEIERKIQTSKKLVIAKYSGKIDYFVIVLELRQDVIVDKKSVDYTTYREEVYRSEVEDLDVEKARRIIDEKISALMVKASDRFNYVKRLYDFAEKLGLEVDIKE